MSNFIKGKVNTLKFLNNKLTLSSVPDFIVVSAISLPEDIEDFYTIIKQKFDNSLVAIRSSASEEDGEQSSMAGAFETVLNVNPCNKDEVIKALGKVYNSFKNKRLVNSEDKIFIQKMIVDINMSGVLFTRELNSGSPYYVVNYDDQSGRSDTVTSGASEYSNRTMYIYRERYLKLNSARHKALISAVREIEELLHSDTLDLEFIINNNFEVHILQVRHISTKKKWKKIDVNLLNEYLKTLEKKLSDKFRRSPLILGKKTILGQMPDWNPVEMIGRLPKALAYSLYEKLITNSSWRIARSIMGYHHPKGHPLMCSIGGQPYIDTRLSFNSFLPNNFDKEIGEKIVDSWLNQLKSNPHKHDKIEFDIAITAFDFDIFERIEEQMLGFLSKIERDKFAISLRSLTKTLIMESGDGSIHASLDKIKILENINEQYSTQTNTETLSISDMINECIEYGTIPFAMLARHGFIAQGFLKSLLKKKIFTEDDLQNFQSSFTTIAGNLIHDLHNLNKGIIDDEFFFKKYGHLRPGTYAIDAPRYDQMKEKIKSSLSTKEKQHQTKFNPSQEQIKNIDKLLKQNDFDNFKTSDLLNYIREATIAREFSKFVFTKTVSNILEEVASIGKNLGFKREDMAHIQLKDLLSITKKTAFKDAKKFILEKINENKSIHSLNSTIKLPELITEKSHIYVIPVQVNNPNFITSKYVKAETVFLKDGVNITNLDNKIVLIEGADPGYDWIFSNKIAGLITQFGGANSHMAIRCAEFSLPAAIGCGDQRFMSYMQAKEIILDCSSSSIIIVR